MRIVCISDTHGYFEPVPDGDVLVHCGDLSNHGTQDEVLEGLSWLSQMPHAHVVFVAGNHDWMLDPNAPPVFGRWPLTRTMSPEAILARFPRVTYLQDAGATIAGRRFYGSPWQPNYFNWAFNFPPGDAGTARDVWSRIPDDVEILVTHTPPFGILDEVPSRRQHVGDVPLRERLDGLPDLRLHAFGHIHEGYGRVERGRTTFVNAATCTVMYRPTNPPIVVDLA